MATTKTSPERSVVRNDSMLLDDIMPTFDATLVEHLVIDATPAAVYRATREMDFMQIHSPLLDLMMWVRTLPTRVRARLGRSAPTKDIPTMQLGALLDNTTSLPGLEGWVGLGESPDNELVFGAVGKFWDLDIEWADVFREEFRDFSEPGYARLAAAFSVRPYGDDRSLLSYEARTACTDDASRRRFLRYWFVVNRFVSVVMRAAVLEVKALAEGLPATQPTIDLTSKHLGAESAVQ